MRPVGRWFPPGIVPLTIRTNRPISLQDSWISAGQNTGSLKHPKHFCDKATMGYWGQFSILIPFNTNRSHGSEIMGMLVDYWDALGFYQLEVWSPYRIFGSQCSWITREGQQERDLRRKILDFLLIWTLVAQEMNWKNERIKIIITLQSSKMRHSCYANIILSNIWRFIFI